MSRPRSTRSSHRTRGRVLLVSASTLLAGCLYGFAGGGFPPEIRTVAVLPFENLTADARLAGEVTSAVREAVERRLGLRASGEAQADAIVRGVITRYEPDLPVAITAGQEGRAEVTRRLVQIVVSVQIWDQKAERMLWEHNSLRLEGDYETGREEEGRRKALDRLTTSIVEGAQSQW